MKLDQLEKLGFPDRKKNLTKLQQYAGNVNLVIQDYKHAPKQQPKPKELLKSRVEAQSAPKSVAKPDPKPLSKPKTATVVKPNVSPKKAPKTESKAPSKTESIAPFKFICELLCPLCVQLNPFCQRIQRHRDYGRFSIVNVHIDPQTHCIV